MSKYIADYIWDGIVPFIPHTREDIECMLRRIGVDDVEELLQGIPDNLRLKQPMNLPPGMSEIEVIREMKRLAGMNKTAVCFTGGGVYDHYRPSAVDEIISRPEFYTAYTPYQPEVSQGTLQAIWEYQSLICQLTGMDAANASLYCGGTAVAEAAALAVRTTGRNKIIAASTVNPHHLQILSTYGKAFPYEIKQIGADNGVVNPGDLKAAVDNETAAVIIQHPNFYGLLEEMDELSAIAHNAGALFIASFDPISLGMLKPPAEYDSDIAVAEGQSLGNPLNYGGPYLGIIASKEKFLRKMPGRLVGETVDMDGKKGYVLTLQTREQHIRRDKATSNICTNEALCALAAAVELCLIGKSGLCEMAEQSMQKAHYLAIRIQEETIFQLKYPYGHFFKEFMVTSEHRAKKVIDTVAQKNLILGPALGRFYPGYDEHSFLIAVTEQRSKGDMDWVIEELKKFK
ncbi:aminomethyl-transferring glycine dehydrogenase subunit GcvPA [bacterium]|nr:aminomethyl-transferring glycine dehydrogenase subunit GcvPA [bacterium]